MSFRFYIYIYIYYIKKHRYVAIPAAALAVFYTADPLSLKAQGLGDVVIFLMFGPMLAAGVCLATVQELPLQPVFYSVPLGLLYETLSRRHLVSLKDIDGVPGYYHHYFLGSVAIDLKNMLTSAIPM